MSEEQPFKALSYDVQNVGKRVKSSKKKFIWKFMLGDKNHQLICSASVVSGKLKIILDGRILLTGEIVVGQPYEHSMTVNGCLITISKEKQVFHLSVNNQNFQDLLGKQRTQSSFKNQQAVVQDVKVTQNFGLDPNKKITLNLAAIGQGMKKKKNTESQNWKQLDNQGIDYFKQQNQGSSKTDPNAKVQDSDSDDQVPTKNQQNATSDLKIQHLGNTTNPSAEQFTTMQILFGTTNNVPKIQSKAPQKKQQPKKQSAIDLLNNFNTMQNLFATQAQTPQLNTQQVPKTVTQPNPSLQEFLKPNADFSTMQALFATTAGQNAQNPQSAVQNLQNLQNLLKTSNNKDLLNNFNTMQNLFATMNVNPTTTTTATGTTTTTTTTNSSAINQQNKLLEQFNTMRNMFATGALGPQFFNINNLNSINQTSTPAATSTPNSISTSTSTNPQLPTPNFENFSTIQQMFATNNLASSQPQSTSTSATTHGTVTVTGTGPSAPQINIADLNDFNTIQNLFKTGNLNLNPNQNPLGN